MTQRFSVLLKKTGFGAPSYTPPADLVLTPIRWSASDRGGMRSCTVQASGSAQSLVYLVGWLGDRIEIYNEQGDLVWWGVLWDLEIAIGNVLYSSTLDSVYNRVAVIYPHQLGDGSVESRTTAWVEDEDSMERYGIRELLYGMPESFTSSAETVRDTLLQRYKAVAPVINTSSGSESPPGATLTGMGVWQKAASIYFTNPDGLIEHDAETTSFYIGRFIESTQIGFGVTTVPGSESDEMYIATGTWSPLAEDDTFTVSGSTSNNDTYTVDHFDAPNKLVIAGNFVNENAGATVRISYGDSISYANAAQAFYTANTWVCTHVALKVRQVGNPTDSFRVVINSTISDGLGGFIPGTALTSNETLGSALFTELTWTEFAFATPVTLTGGVTYWLNFRRTGTINLADGYEVSLDEDLGYVDGVALFYNGSAWVTHSPDVDIPFRVIGEISSTAQIEKVLNSVDAFNLSLVQVDSLVPVRQFSDDQRTASEELNEMLDAGMSTGERIIAYVLPDDSVVVTSAETLGYGEAPAMLDAKGKLRYATGGFVSPGKVIFGQTIAMSGLMLFDSMNVHSVRGAGQGIYIVESEYDAITDSLSVQSEGALDPFQALVTRKG